MGNFGQDPVSLTFLNLSTLSPGPVRGTIVRSKVNPAGEGGEVKGDIQLGGQVQPGGSGQRSIQVGGCHPARGVRSKVNPAGGGQVQTVLVNPAGGGSGPAGQGGGVRSSQWGGGVSILHPKLRVVCLLTWTIMFELYCYFKIPSRRKILKRGAPGHGLNNFITDLEYTDKGQVNHNMAP